MGGQGVHAQGGSGAILTNLTEEVTFLEGAMHRLEEEYQEIPDATRPAKVRQYLRLAKEAFQIKDYLLVIEGDEQDIGKKTQKDSTKGKETLISLMGKDKAKKKSQELIDKSIKILEKFGKKAKNLIDLTEFIISRTK